MSAQRRRGALGAAAATLVLAGIAGCGGMRDTGGSVVAASTAMLQARASGQPVEIRGTCYSACALKLASGNGLCIAPSARIGVHEVRRAISPARYGLGARDDFATAFFETLLPRCAHDLFASLHGFGQRHADRRVWPGYLGRLPANPRLSGQPVRKHRAVGPSLTAPLVD